MANVLKSKGVKKGDRVTIYMPMIPEATYAMLACARIGAIHSVVFGGFSPDSIADRIIDCKSDYVITSDEGYRAGKIIPLKNNVDIALNRCPNVKSVLVIKRTGNKINMFPNRDIWWHEEKLKVSKDCEPTVMNAEDPLVYFIYVRINRKPKGVLHTSGGYIVYAAITHKYIFDYKKTKSIGVLRMWVGSLATLISFMVPLANGAKTLMFEGVPNYPSSSRFWEVIDKHSVNIFYTAPTAIRALMKEGRCSS